GLAVGRHRELEDYVRPAIADAADVAGVRTLGFVRAKPDFDPDTGLGEPPMAGARHFRVRIDQRRYHADDAGRDDGVGTGRGLAVMRAGLERHVEGGAARGGAGAPQCLDLGMRSSTRLRPATP